MATINSLTSSSSSAYGTNSKGIGGLASGLDTDEIIKGMTLGTRTKIAKQMQSKQLLSWQTDAYRSVSNKLISFSKKYTSYTSSTNLSSPTFYLQNEITTGGSNSDKISVSGTSSMADQLSILSATQATTGSLISGGPSLPDKLNASGTVTPADFKLLEGKSISLSYNGSVKTVSFSAADAAALDGKNITDFQAALQTKIDTAFGAGKITVASDSDKLNFSTVASTDVLKITTIDDVTKGITGLSTGDSNRLNLNKKLSELGIADIKDFKLTSGIDVVNIGATLKDDATISDLMYAVGKSGKNITMSYVESLNKFQFTSTNTEKVELSGQLAEGLVGAPVGGKIDIPASTEAELQFKYANDPSGNTITLKSSTNTFSLDGLNIKVNQSFSSGDAVTLSSKADTTKVISAIKDMVKDYNEIVDLVNSELSTKRNRNYAPLTDEQKEDMSESEIKAWEEKSKQGMLFGNSDMASLSGELRSVFFSSGTSMADLQSIGISTSNDWRDNGKIVIDETKLKSAIDSDSTKIQGIFSDKLTNKKDVSGNDLLFNGEVVPDTKSGGVMSRLQNLMATYSKTEGATKGILIEKAGNTAAPLSLIKNSLLDKMNNIDLIVKNLKFTLTSEQKRYQSQFTRLERVISQLNSQSSWLSQQ